MKYSLSEAEYFMKRALDESRKALPLCRPNPPVGCVLVKNSQIVALGYTHTPGHYHAEAHALSLIQDEKLDEYSAFVTLEPCSFVGRTPSCAKTLVERGIGEVYVSLLDPHPKNQGRGMDILENAQIPFVVGILQDDVKLFLDQYLIYEDS